MAKHSDPVEAVGRLREAFQTMTAVDQETLIELLRRYLADRQIRQLVGLSEREMRQRSPGVFRAAGAKPFKMEEAKPYRGPGT
jgi:hypothetical protein